MYIKSMNKRYTPTLQKIQQINQGHTQNQQLTRINNVYQQRVSTSSISVSTGPSLTKPLDTAKPDEREKDGSVFSYSSWIGWIRTVCLWIVRMELVGTETQLSFLVCR